MRTNSFFTIYRTKENISEKIFVENSHDAIKKYHESKAEGFRARLFNQDGIQIAGIWR